MNDRFGLTPDERELLRTILNSTEEHIERVSVFGSRAQGRHRPHSDLDLVLYGSADEASCAHLITLFQESPLPFSVDIVNYSPNLHPPLRRHIDAVAQPLFVHTGERLEDAELY